MLRVAIIGASGYTGSESIGIINRHPKAELTYLTYSSSKSIKVEDMFGQFKGRCDLEIEALDIDKLSRVADVALCCLPHKVSMGFVPELLDAGVKVVDFSADYRLKDVKVYEQFYQEHTDVENLKHAVYGLPEFYREKVKSAKLVANPGCFPTGLMLGLAPLLKEKLINTDTVINNAVTGTSGAGKKPSDKFHFPNMNENMFAYGVGKHRHGPEMEQVAAELYGEDVGVLFQPHVGPFDRGILSSIYCEPLSELTTEQLGVLYEDFYKNEKFVQILKEAPILKNVAFTNYCHLYPAVVKGKVVIFSAIDNMLKGAAGQAVQNMNIMYGFDEATGLE